MNISTIKGTVQQHVKKPFESAHGTMIGHNITVNTEAGNVQVNKTTKPETQFDLIAGTHIQVSYDAVSGVNKTGKAYTINKIVKDGLVILSGGPTQPTSTVTTSSTPTTTLPTLTKSSSEDSNGPRNGMITGKAVELAVARGDMRLEGLKIAASDILKLAHFVESGAKLETTVKEPAKEVKTASAKTATVVAELATLDEDDFSFDE